MGSFIGHVIPGTFFIVFGVWWTIQIWRKYLRAFSQSGTRFKCQVSYPPFSNRKRMFDSEAAIVVAAAAIGMLVELFFAGSFRGKTIGVNNMQHATMYFFFGFLGLIGLLTPLLKKLFPNIEDIKYIGLVLAYTSEAILFKFHLMGRDMLDITLHTLLLYAVYGAIILTLVELACREQVLASLGRAYFTILQGTWFLQVAFILYNPLTDHMEWDHENHEHIMFTTCIYTWHSGIIALFTLGCGIGLAAIYRKRGELGDADVALETVANGYSHLLANQDEEEEVTTKLQS